MKKQASRKAIPFVCMDLTFNIINKKEDKMTSNQRDYLKRIAMTMDTILKLGKSGLTP